MSRYINTWCTLVTVILQGTLQYVKIMLEARNKISYISYIIMIEARILKDLGKCQVPIISIYSCFDTLFTKMSMQLPEAYLEPCQLPMIELPGENSSLFS